MNIILFQPEELPRPLPLDDPRSQHILKTLRRAIGDTLDIGLINGPRGKATLEKITPQHLHLTFALEKTAPPPLDPITLIIGLPRPQTARKILQEATALGATTLHFVQTEKTEPSYAQSTLWTTREYTRHLHAGAAQAFDTQIPEITHTETLASLLPTLGTSTRIALDNYESPTPLSPLHTGTSPAPITLALGPERGWGPADRQLLRQHHFLFAHLGPRPLRQETALTAALALLKSFRNSW